MPRHYHGEERRINNLILSDPAWQLRLHYGDGITVYCPLEHREMKATGEGSRCPVCGPVKIEMVPLVTLPTTPKPAGCWCCRTRDADRLQVMTLDPDYYAECDGADRRFIHAARADERARGCLA